MGAVVGGGKEGEEDEELRQTKEQAAARRRWEALVRFFHLVCNPAHFICSANFSSSYSQLETAVLLECFFLLFFSCKCNVCLNLAPAHYIYDV